MTEQSNQPQNPPTGNEQPEVYSVSQDKDGSFQFTRRGFLYISAAIGGTLLVRGVCQRFGAGLAPSEAIQAGMSPLSSVYIHTAPSIASNIAATLQQNDLVRLVSDHPDLGWVEVATRSGQHGWVKRSFVDFSRAIKSSSPNFDLSSTPTPAPTQTASPPTFSVQLHGGDNNPKKALAAGPAQPCGEVIQNGDFEAGSVSWVQESTGDIIRSDWPDPYQGSWVAWFGGPDASERLTQLFHVPADVQDAQKFEFYVKVTSEETSDQVSDRFSLRFLDAGGKPLCPDILIATNTTKTDWMRISIDLTGVSEHADRDMQIQFVCVTDSINNTSFVIDSVSLDLICETSTYYVYLPVIVRAPTHTPTQTPTSTPTPSATPCPSHTPCTCDSYVPCTCNTYSGCTCESDVPCVCDTYRACTCVSHYCSCEYYWPW
jgi:uncharacterized protein YgiM (DUF1202 family)